MKHLEEIKVLPILESLDFLHQTGASLARFGDGEIDLILGSSIPYQPYHPDLASRLLDILQTESSQDLLVCLPDVFENLERYNSNARLFWKTHFNRYQSFYEEYCQSPWYGSTFLSRPYIDLADKSQSDLYFEEIRKLWQGKDILIVEGETSRSGVGNRLFENARSVERIICPSRDAYAYYDEIMEAILDYAQDKLILLMLGPTAKLLAYDLRQVGYRALDLGHIDSEYEWWQMKATSKVKLNSKHTAEFNYDHDIEENVDPAYLNQVLTWIGVEDKQAERRRLMEQAQVQEGKQDDELISVIVPVYNVHQYLRRCLDSIVTQTYPHLEILVINDGSTDGSAFILEEYAKKDKRIRVIHQENQGVSSARNKGIDIAQGAYITFIDSDDFVEKDYIENLYQAVIKTGSDIAACNFTAFDDERKVFKFFHHEGNHFEKVYSIQEWFDLEGDMKNNMHLAFTFSPLKLFKRSLFESIRYPLGRLREDDATIYKLYLKANQIHFHNHGPYYYSQRPEGLSRTEMLRDIATMISNAEERIALMVLRGLDPTGQIKYYIGRLKKCQADALYAGQIELYQSITAKLELLNEAS